MELQVMQESVSGTASLNVQWNQWCVW